MKRLYYILFFAIGLFVISCGKDDPYQPVDDQKPTAPANLVASDQTETSLKLSWSASTDNVGVVGYNIYQNGTKILSPVTATSNIY